MFIKESLTQLADPIELDDFLKWTPPALTPIVASGLMYEGTKVIIYGKYKSLKSMLATRFCLSVAQGKSWLGFDTVKSSVMYLQLEVPNPMLQKRVNKMALTLDINHLPFYIWTEPSIKIDTNEGYNKIGEMIEKYKPRVLVIDPIYKIMTGDMLNTQHVQRLVDWIDDLIAKYGVSIVLVHHTRKGKQDEVIWGDTDDMLGSVIFSAWADTVIKIERRKNKEVVVKFEVVRHAEDEIVSKVIDVDLANLDFVPTGRII